MSNKQKLLAAVVAALIAGLVAFQANWFGSEDEAPAVETPAAPVEAAPAAPTEPAVEPAASEAVPATGESASEAVRPAESEVAEFTAIVLRGSTEEATAFMRNLHARGASADSLYLDLLAPSARYLGELWTIERTDFVEVTVALHRLQDLAHKFSAYLRGTDDAETVLPAGPRALCVA